jgi:hypothetical protein
VRQKTKYLRTRCSGAQSLAVSVCPSTQQSTPTAHLYSRASCTFSPNRFADVNKIKAQFESAEQRLEILSSTIEAIKQSFESRLHTQANVCIVWLCVLMHVPACALIVDAVRAKEIAKINFLDDPDFNYGATNQHR